MKKNFILRIIKQKTGVRMNRIKNHIKNFVELTRAYTLQMTLASCFIIFCFAYYSEHFTFLNFFLMLTGLCCVQLGANLFDDYVDIKNKMKNGCKLSDVHFDSFRPKARLIINGTYNLAQVERILNILFSIAIGVGVCFTIFAGWKILLFMLLGGILTLLYPISSKYYLAEIIVGLCFGPLMITGGYFGLTFQFNPNLFLLSWAIFFSTLVLLHTHSLMDWEFDIKNNKNTLCIFSKTKENAIKILTGFIIVSYTIVVFGVLSAKFNPNMLYVFLTLPIATKLIESMKEYINIKDVKFEPRWYWGFFENWSEIKENHIDFFMFRFYLARNFAFFFALFASIGAMV